MSLSYKISKIAKLTTLALGLSISLNSQAHKHDHKILSFETTELSPGLYMLSGVGGFTGGNIGLVVGDDGVVMIDNGVPAVLDLLRKEINKTTTKPVDYLINTHLHQDHTGNNISFANKGAQVISHHNVREALKQKSTEEDSLPIMTFSDQLTLHINNESAKIIHVKSAHTNGDAIIHFEKSNVIHTGDLLFNKIFPFIDGDNGGTLDGVITGLKLILSLSNEKTKIIPGHGPLANKSDIERTIALLEDSRKLVHNLVESGKSDEEIFEINPLKKYESYSWGFINTKKMTQQVLSNVR